ncbi:uncharacterized protein A4U43_C06F9590 [Asparagus officinalis]|uniref:Uncharacterized protein n=1 Tax=Asparagus officinalis TaxID=4686 RepID=A0A5P1EN49_ASPOF|nr:uncharacterized protein A4U43_C06F9590 [Asparagus officinalis]
MRGYLGAVWLPLLDAESLSKLTLAKTSFLEAGGGGSRRDDGPLKIGSANGFAVLESLKKKKKPDKVSSKSEGPSKSKAKEPEEPVFWNPKPLVNKSWADVEDEDDDDYYASSAPLRGIWGSSESGNQKKEIEIEAVMEELQESESEDGGLDEGVENIQDEPEPEPEAPIASEPTKNKPLPTTSAPKENERQLSKKELKKKGLEELDALLAELGISSQEQSNEGKKSEEQNGQGGKKESVSAPSESKTSKKKKSKKDKSSKETTDAREEQQQQPNGGYTNKDTEKDNYTEKDVSGAKDTEDNGSTADVKGRLKKVVPMKKKKTNKEMDAAARAGFLP